MPISMGFVRVTVPVLCSWFDLLFRCVVLGLFVPLLVFQFFP